MRLRDAAVLLLLSAMADPAAGQTPAGSPGQGATLEGTSWQLTSLPGHKPADLAALPRRATLRLGDGRAMGFTGCNLLTGTYTIQETSVTLKLGSTMMACPEPGSSIERAFVEALRGTLSYAITGDRLTLTTASGAALEFEREPAPTLGGRTWSVTQYNNGRQAVVSLLPDTVLTLSFENGAVSGQAGCNTFRATYSVQGGGITIGPPATTRKSCAEPLMAQERAFLTALESATRWTIDGGILDMHRADGERALSAKPGDAN
jgi:heat shock protein HslJ